jgi:transcriptional regulator NrdR family protein
MEDEERDRYMQ